MARGKAAPSRPVAAQPEDDPSRLEALALLARGIARLTGLPLNDAYMEAMVTGVADLVPHLDYVIDWAYGDIRLVIDRGRVVAVEPARRYQGTPRPPPGPS